MTNRESTDDSSTAPAATSIRRWRVWVDRGGGFDVWQGDQFTIGGAGGDPPAELAVRCGWPRRVARLLRTPTGDQLETDPLATVCPLRDEQRLPLERRGSVGDAGPQLDYRRPSPLSRSAVITVAPPYRWVSPVDATILFDQTLLIGPEPFNHIRVARLSSQEWVLFRRRDRWWIRGNRLDAEPIDECRPWRREDWSLVIESDSVG